VLLILALLSWTTVSSFSVLEIIALSEKLPLSEISRDVEVVVAKAVDAKELKSNAPADTAEAILILLIISASKYMTKYFRSKIKCKFYDLLLELTLGMWEAAINP